MYSMTHNGNILFDPRLNGFPLGSPKLTREANKIGAVSFTIYPGNPEYGSIRALSSEISVYKDGRIYWMGRPATSKLAFRGGIDYQCEEITAFLNDHKIREMQFSGTVQAFFAQIINDYNGKQNARRFEPGTVTVQGDLNIAISDYPGHWDALQKYLVDVFGGYILPRYENGAVYLDYITEDDLPEAAQKIRFGENLTSLFIDTSSDDTFSVLIPFGKQVDGKKITIKPVNDGLDYVVNNDAADLYGLRETTLDFPEISTPEKLLEAARDYLNNTAVKFRRTVQLTAVDLHNADLSIESFGFLQWVTAESEKHGLSAKYLSAREEVPLGKPTGTKLTLGETTRTITDTVSAVTASAAIATAAITAAEASSQAAEINSQHAAEEAEKSEQALAAIVGAQNSNSLLWVYGPEGNRTLKINPAYTFFVQNYDVAAKLAEIGG